MDNITLREASLDDCKLLYKWQIIPNIRQYFRNKEVPNFEEHSSWFKKRINSQGRQKGLLLIILLAGQECGYVRLDRLPDRSNTFDISVLVDPQFSGQSIGSRALQEVSKNYPHYKMIAEVSERNVASVRMLQKAGFLYDGKHFIYPG